VSSESSGPSHVGCARCRRAPRDDADFVEWEELDDGKVCRGCLTMLEVERLGRKDDPIAD
jgi:hypothetical protein